MIKHKELFNQLANKYNLHYFRGEGGLYPTNYHNFKDVSGELYLQIEIIPKGKYLRTAYCMFTGLEYTNKEAVYNFIVEHYKKQKEGQGVDFCVDNNAGFDSYII